jgi:hypothetical protein
MPPQHRDHVCAQLVAAMRSQFADVAAAQASGVHSDESKAKEGKRIGQRAVTQLSTTLAGIEKHYADWHRDQALKQQAATDPEVEQLRKFLGPHGPSTNGASYRPASGPATDNVRHLRPRTGLGKE